MSYIFSTQAKSRPLISINCVKYHRRLSCLRSHKDGRGQVSLLKFFPVHAIIFCRSYITFSPHLYYWACALRGYAVREQRGLAKPKVSVPPALFFVTTFIQLSFVFYFFIVPLSFSLSFIHSFLIFHSNFPIVLGLAGLTL